MLVVVADLDDRGLRRHLRDDLLARERLADLDDGRGGPDGDGDVLGALGDLLEVHLVDRRVADLGDEDDAVVRVDAVGDHVAVAPGPRDLGQDVVPAADREDEEVRGRGGREVHHVAPRAPAQETVEVGEPDGVGERGPEADLVGVGLGRRGGHRRDLAVHHRARDRAHVVVAPQELGLEVGEGRDEGGDEARVQADLRAVVPPAERDELVVVGRGLGRGGHEDVVGPAGDVDGLEGLDLGVGRRERVAELLEQGAHAHRGLSTKERLGRACYNRGCPRRPMDPLRRLQVTSTFRRRVAFLPPRPPPHGFGFLAVLMKVRNAQRTLVSAHFR